MTNTRLKLGGYEVWIVVEGEEVEHYAHEVDEEAKIATCWIASTVGTVIYSLELDFTLSSKFHP